MSVGRVPRGPSDLFVLGPRLMRSVAKRLFEDEQGQDLIEYVLLGAFIGLVGIAAFTAIRTAIGSAYVTFNSSENNNWRMPDPGSGGS